MQQVKIDVIGAQFAKTCFEVGPGVFHAESAAFYQPLRPAMQEAARGGHKLHEPPPCLHGKTQRIRAPRRFDAELRRNRDLRAARFHEGSQPPFGFPVSIGAGNVKVTHSRIKRCREQVKRFFLANARKGAATKSNDWYLDVYARNSDRTHPFPL